MRKSPKQFCILTNVLIGVARSLAVLMVAMLKKMNAPYIPLSEANEKELAAMLISA